MRNQEVIDATQLIFGFDYNGFHTIETGSEQLARINQSDPQNRAEMLGGSLRAVLAFDSKQQCYVAATEMFASGRNNSDQDIEDIHFVLVRWDDAVGTTCIIDLDSGIVLEAPDGDINTSRELELEKELEWKKTHYFCAWRTC